MFISLQNMFESSLRIRFGNEHTWENYLYDFVSEEPMTHSGLPHSCGVVAAALITYQPMDYTEFVTTISTDLTITTLNDPTQTRRDARRVFRCAIQRGVGNSRSVKLRGSI